MALTALEKQSFRRGIADEAAANDLLTIINSGSADTLTTLTEKALRNAIAHDRVASELITALDTGGSTLGTEAREVCRQLMRNGVQGDNLVTEIEAIS